MNESRLKAPSVKTVLAAAGYDPTGAAGVQADLKTIAANGADAACVVTAVTAQNSRGVQSAFHLPAETVRAQLNAVLDDAAPDAVKTGMLASSNIVETIAETLKRRGAPNLVIDPVLASSGGYSLLTDDGVDALLRELWPLARVVCPNAAEAAILTGMQVESVQDAKKAAAKLRRLGAEWVVVKGGHLTKTDKAVDLLYDGRSYVELDAPRLPGPSPRGTGCAFSSAVAAHLARGSSVLEAAGAAKAYVYGAMERAVRVGQGASRLRHFWKKP